MTAKLLTRNLRAARNNRAYLCRAHRNHGTGPRPAFAIFHRAGTLRRLRPVAQYGRWLFRFGMSGLTTIEVQA